jgi:hypothetical protein
MVRWDIMIHYFITWFEYNGHYENCKSRYAWKGWNLNIKSKMGSENHRSLATGRHPRYMLPNHHEVRKDLRLIDI